MIYLESLMSRINISDKEIISAAKSTTSATAAAAMLGIQYGTYRSHAKRLNVFKTNQSGKGTKKPKTEGNGKIATKDILEGKHPQYQSNKLRKRLFNEGYKERKCEMCGITEWNGKPLSFECEHINGDSTDHRLKNLMIVCPNCHSQTETYKGKNAKRPCNPIGRDN